MSVHDTIGDFLTVIRNAGGVGKEACTYPHSKLREDIARILKEQGYVEDYAETADTRGHKSLEVRLKYVDGNHVIKGLSRESTPGRRVYCKYREVPRVLGGLGVAILSTSSGLLTDREATKKGVGGEVLAYVW